MYLKMKRKIGSPKKKRTSLRSILIGILAAAWMIPIAVFTWFIFYHYQRAYTEKSDNLIRNAVEVSAVLIKTDIDEAIIKSRKPSYEGEWESGYMGYIRGNTRRNAYLASIKSSLISKYYMDNRIARYAFYLEGDETPSCYSAKNGYSYGDFLKYVQPVALDLAQRDTSYVEIHVVDNQIYVMRNLYTVSDYHRYGTLVLGLNKSALFSGLPLEGEAKVLLSFPDDEEFLSLYPEKEKEIYRILRGYAEEDEARGGTVSLAIGSERGYCHTCVTDNYTFTLYYTTPGEALYKDVFRLNVIALITMLCMVPLMILTFFLLSRHMQKPLEKLAAVSRRLREGGLGITLPKEQIPNEEFTELVESFNDMSSQLKHLFDTVYLERMAAKDAQIEALQAQINPHFLNNTLEMMNWQSRMNGDIETSRMIEALGTVLDAGMNRNNDRLVRLAEELRCGDAFLYIMSMRFGTRLRVEKEIKADTMQVKVPRLILQPLLENAIRHGIEKVNSGIIWLKIYPVEDSGGDFDGERIFIDVVNTSRPLGPEKMEYIEGIICGRHAMDRGEPGAHTSIGIYNVNRRIQLIYGVQYGLGVFQEGELFTTRITIPKNFEEDNDG
ncbi:MAG: histidine kinase [Lachnospiraceae bacterium]|nr:histidine kinase [Lachnospiraceae bacterium]